jgi:vancomycin resistance protein YoaR
MTVDLEATVATAYAVGRTGPLSRRLSVWRTLFSSGVEITPIIHYDEGLLREKAVEWADYYRRQPRNAHLDPRTGSVSQEESGREVDFESALDKVRDALIVGDDRRLVRLPVKTLRPSVTMSQLTEVGAHRVLGQFTTRFDPADANRTHNIALSSAAIDGLVLRPGEVFSFNKVVGARTIERGFKAAPEIIRERLVTGIGGGVCQVSSTLYDAVLNARLAVVERTNHSQPLGYVQVGLDATVYFGLIDFKFKNSLGSPVVLATEVKDGSLTVAVCGRDEDRPDVKIQIGAVEPVEPSEVVEEDPALPPGARVRDQEPKIGYKVEVWRILYRNGREVGRERISKDYYKPRPLVWKVGPTPEGAASRVRTEDSRDEALVSPQ